MNDCKILIRQVIHYYHYDRNRCAHDEEAQRNFAAELGVAFLIREVEIFCDVREVGS